MRLKIAILALLIIPLFAPIRDTSADDGKAALMAKAEALEDQNKLKEARATYMEVFKLDPKDDIAAFKIAYLSTDLDDEAGAVEWYTHYLNFIPGNIDALSNRGLSYYHLEKYNEAIDDFNAVLRAKPNYWPALVNRAFTFTDKGNFEQAIKDADRALLVEPNRSIIYQVRGRAKLKKGDLEGARKDLDKALELNPQDIKALQDQSELFKKLGDSKAAKVAQSKADGIAKSENFNKLENDRTVVSSTDTEGQAGHED